MVINLRRPAAQSLGTQRFIIGGCTFQGAGNEALVFFANHMLVGVVKIQAKSLCHSNRTFYAFRLGVNQADPSVHESILNETQQRFHSIQSVQDNTDGMKGETSDKEAPRWSVVEEMAGLFGPLSWSGSRSSHTFVSTRYTWDGSSPIR